MRWAPRAALAAIALAVGAAAVADARIVPAVEVPRPVAAEAAPAGAWYCPVTADDTGAATLTVAAVGKRPSTVTVVPYPEGAPAPLEPVEVAPDAPRSFDVDPRHPVAVRWDGGPAAASWRVESAGESAGGPCASAASPTWYVTGFDTALGATSTLHLFNPFAVDAMVRVTFATPDGAVSLQRTDSVVVPAGQATRLALNDLQPEEEALAASVEVLAGRVVAAGEVAFDPPEGPDGEPGRGPRGRAVLPGAAAAAPDWGFGLARSDEQADAWLVVANPQERRAEIELRASDPVADSAVLGAGSVPAGGVARIDLARASERVEAGVALSSVNGVEVVAAKLTAFHDGDRVGVIGGLGADPSPEAVLVGAGTEGRATRVGVYNPAGTPVTLEVDAGAGTPAGWRGAELGPNEQLVVDLAAVEDASGLLPVTVRASGPVLTELRSTEPGDRMAAWGATGLTPRHWTGPPTRPSVRRDAALPTAAGAPPDD